MYNVEEKKKQCPEDDLKDRKKSTQIQDHKNGDGLDT